jgi:two-component system nitrogen regulation response regulator GlnG
MNTTVKILIVDDESSIRKVLARLMTKEGYLVVECADGPSALKSICMEPPEMVLLDLRMPGMDGMEVLRKIKVLDPDLPVVIITGNANLHGAVEAMRQGAHDYLAKPFEHPEVIRIVRRAVAERCLKRRLQNMSAQLNGNLSLAKMMGPSEVVARLIADVNRVARSDFTVVIFGETGVGKELVARAIHHNSPRSGTPFVAIDCGAIPETLLENELFGHEKGAFTGASEKKVGKFEAAHGGTLLLDEVVNMSLESQAKLLRVLQDKKVCRVGSNSSLDVDVRLVVSSNRRMEDAVADGDFRQDLLYRLNDFAITIPPLRERREDIPYLANRFLEATNIELGKQVEGFSQNALESLMTYSWPGNVRQLRSVIRRAVLLSDGTIDKHHLNLKNECCSGPAEDSCAMLENDRRLSLKEIVQRNTLALERTVLTQTLNQTGGNKAQAARLLQIDYKTMHTKIKKLGISAKGEPT